jgi:RNA polymerase sigma-70 factor (ECF subfamily)
MKLEDLFLLAKKGDGRAFEQIVLQTERAVYNLALSIVKKKEDAEDVTQETYLRLWRTANDLKIENSLKSYILRTARNLALDLIRKNSKHANDDTVILNADGEFEIDIEDTSPDSRPDAAYLQKIEKEAIRASVSELPPSAKELIILRDIEGLPYSEIASMLGIAEGTLKSKLFRARERLRKIILSKNIF